MIQLIRNVYSLGLECLSLWDDLGTGFRTSRSRDIDLSDVSVSSRSWDSNVSRPIASPETSSTSRATFRPNTNYVKLKLQLSQISGSLDNELFILLKLTKLHLVISQVISTQHGLRSLMQPATPVVCTGKLSAARTSQRRVGLIIKPTRNRQSKDRLSQRVFCKLNLRKHIRIVLFL